MEIGLEEIRKPAPVLAGGIALVSLGLNEKVPSETLRIIMLVLGLALIVLGTVLWTVENSPCKSRKDIAGRYLGAELGDLTITRLDRHGLYKAETIPWTGVGLFNDQVYYGIYRYKETPGAADPRLGGHWGVHKLEWNSQRESLKVRALDLTDYRLEDWGSWTKKTGAKN